MEGDSFFRAANRTVSVDGVEVQTYEYRSVQAVDRFRSGVSRDGYTVPTQRGGSAVVRWVAPPHFYGAGRLIVLYFGDSPRTLLALNDVLGRPFAGSEA